MRAIAGMAVLVKFCAGAALSPALSLKGEGAVRTG
ncbi:hypothetical protein J2T47_003363 [Pseudomonas nitroreducens]|nr:hypothetical protein [Pseudomonas nitroreducens]